MAPGPAISSSCSYSTPSRAWSAGCPAACTRPSQPTTAGTIATSLQNATSSPVWIFAARAAARTDSKITQSGRKQAEDCLARIGAGCLGGRRRRLLHRNSGCRDIVGWYRRQARTKWVVVMRRYLVVANQALQAAELRKSFASGSRRDRVPSTCSSQHQRRALSRRARPRRRHPPGLAWCATDYRSPAADKEASAQARQRLNQMLADLGALGRPRRGRPREFPPAGGDGEGLHRSPVRPDHRGHAAPAPLALASGRLAPSGRAPVQAAGHDHHHEALTRQLAASRPGRN